jgi:hypothetical protein
VGRQPSTGKRLARRYDQFMDLHPSCPYCGDHADTADHIFPEFMGGKHKVPSCRECNSRFGHSFEAVVSDLFSKIHIYLAGNGLRLRVPLGRWKRAFDQDGETYDIVAEQGGLRFLLSDPVVEIDEETRVLNARFRSEKQARKVLSSIRKKYGVEAPVDISITPAIMPPIELHFGQEAARLAMKMCSAQASTLPAFRPDELFLAGDRVKKYVGTATLDFRTHEWPERQPEPLAHVIYVERTNIGLRGIVKFFGVYQFYCRIGPPILGSSPAARIGVLDPMEGIESFESVTCVDIPEAETEGTERAVQTGLSQWADRFRDAAVARGAQESLWIKYKPSSE